MSLGGLVDKILVYQSYGHGFDPSYRSYGHGFDPSYKHLFSFFLFFFDHTHMHICIFGMQRVKEKEEDAFHGSHC